MSKSVWYMIVSAFCFGIMQVCVKFLKDFPTTELVLFRSLITLTISFVMIKRLNLPTFGNNKKYLFLRGLFGMIALTLYFFTLQHLPIATAITINYLSPIFTVFFAIFILKEPMKWVQWVFFGISFVGVAVIKGFNSDVSAIYLICGIISAVFAGLAYNMVRKVKDTDHPITVVFYFPLVATPIMLLASIPVWKNPHGVEWLWLLLMGVSTQIAQLYMTKGLQSGEMNKVAPLKYIGILFAIFFDYTLFDILPKESLIIGMFLVIGGILLNLLYTNRQKKKAQKNAITG